MTAKHDADALAQRAHSLTQSRQYERAAKMYLNAQAAYQERVDLDLVHPNSLDARRVNRMGEMAAWCLDQLARDAS